MVAQVSASVSPGAPSSVPYGTGLPFVRVYALRVTSIALDVALDASTKAVERVPTFEMRADWNMNGAYDHRFSDLKSIVQSFTFTQELATALPAAVGFVEGTAASKLQVTLGGQWMPDTILNPDETYVEDTDALHAFSPYGPTGPGPVLGRLLELRTGFQTSEGPVNLLRFTGTVSGYAPTASTREVVMDGLDPVARLRKAITIYAYGIDGIVLTRYGNGAYPFVVNSQWYVDNVLRQNGYYASPPPGGNVSLVGGASVGAISDGNVALSVTMHGSQQHEIGQATYVLNDYYTNPASGWVQPYLYGATADPSDPVAHPFQMMYPRPGLTWTTKWISRSAFPMRTDVDGWGMSGWVQLPAGGSTVSDYIWSAVPCDGMALQLRLVNGVPHIYMAYPYNGQTAQGLYNISGFALTSAPRWVFIGVHFTATSDGILLTMKFDQMWGQAKLSGYPITSGLAYYNNARVYGKTIVPFTNFSVWYSPSVPGPLDWRGQSWTPTAYVDPSFNWMGGMTDIINRESYDLIKEIVEAEFATFYFDEYGKPFFRTRLVNRGWNRPPELITSDRDISELALTVDDSGVRNSIDAEYAAKVAGLWETVWEPDDPYFFTLGANQFNTWILPLPDNCVQVAETEDGQIVKWVSSEVFDQVDDNPFYLGKLVFACSLMSDPTMDVYSSVLAGKLATAKLVFRVRRVDARSVSVRIDSFCPYAIRFATASKVGTNSATGGRDDNMVTEGKPAFRVPGRLMTEIPSTAYSLRHDASIQRYGTQTYDLGGKSDWRQTGDAVQILSAQVLGYTARPRPVLSTVEVPHNPRRRLRDKIILTEPDGFGARIWCTIYGISTTFDENGARDQLTLRPDDAPPSW